MIMKTTNGKITPVERNSRDKSANNRSKSRNERESMSLNKTSIDKNADQQYSYTPTIKATYKPLDIFSKDELMPNCKPIFLSKSTQKLFNIIADEEITKESSIILLNKLDILKDIQLRASISDFSIEKNAIKNYPNSQILLIYDSDYKFNQNFIIVLSEEIKLQILNSIEQTNDNHAEEDNNEKKNEIDENVYNNNDNEYNDTSSFIFKTKSNHDWIDLGSKNEIIEMNSIELRSKICTIYQRSRKQFGSVLHLHDDNAIINKSFTEYISMHEDKSFNIPIIELDKSITNCIIKYDKSINTQWKYPKNAFTQYMPRMYTSNELQQFYHNNVLRNMPNLYTLFKQNLLENEMYNFLSNDYENLSTNDEIYDDDNNNNNDHHLFKEYLSFTDLKYSKNKSITMIQWHPTIKHIIATSISEHLTYNQRIDQLSRILLQSTYIIIWSLNDPLKPQLLLNAPEDIICFQFNPTNINYIAGGCINGQVVLWDIEKYLNHLIHIKQYLKQINNKKNLFLFNENDLYTIPILQYSALSNIESSHNSPIMNIKWLPDHLEINRLGYCYQNSIQKCIQLMTCGLNNEILIWDIRINKTPLVINKLNDIIQPSMNVPLTFSALNMKWKPLLRIHLYSIDSMNDYVPIKFCIREIQGDRRLLTSNSTDSNISTIDNSSKLLPLPNADTHIYVGTEDGDIVYVDWMPHKDQDTGKMQTPKPEFCASRHDGPICFLERSPFDSSLILSIGGWLWTLWKEGITSGPIIESGRANKPLTGGSWSPSRPSVFYICRADGSVEVWDLLDKTNEPTMIQSISANPLTAISIWDSPKRQFVATGDIQGVLQLFVVPHRFKTALPSELKKFNAYIEREVKRIEFVLMRWNLREQEKIEQEVEKKRKAGLTPTIVLSDEEIIQKEKLEYEKYLSEEHIFLRGLGLTEEDD